MLKHIKKMNPIITGDLLTFLVENQIFAFPFFKILPYASGLNISETL